VCGCYPPAGRHAAVVGIVRCGSAGQRSHRDARGADHGRGAVPETSTGGLQRLYGESPVPAHPVCLVSSAWVSFAIAMVSHGERNAVARTTGVPWFLMLPAPAPPRQASFGVGQRSVGGFMVITDGFLFI